MKQITPPAFVELEDSDKRIERRESDLVFNITNQSLKLLLKLAPNARTGHDGCKINRENALVVQGLSRNQSEHTIQRKESILLELLLRQSGLQAPLE